MTPLRTLPTVKPDHRQRRLDHPGWCILAQAEAVARTIGEMAGLRGEPLWEHRAELDDLIAITGAAAGMTEHTVRASLLAEYRLARARMRRAARMGPQGRRCGVCGQG